MLTVRQATLADRPAIVDLLHDAYPGREQYKHPERWHWQFVANPFCEPRSCPCGWPWMDHGSWARPAR